MKLPWADRTLSHSRLYAAAVLAVLLYAAYSLGVWMGTEDFDALLTLPAGAVYLSMRTHTIVASSPDNPQWIHLTRVPTPEQARMVRWFSVGAPQAPAPAAEATTTTTVPKKEEKKP